MSTRLRQLLSPVLLAALLAAGAAACGGSSFISTDAFRQARALTSEMGELEDRAEALTRGLGAALSDPADSPDAAIARLAAYVDENVDEMNEVAAALAAKFAALEGPELQAYHEVMAERFSEPTFAWRDAFFGFIEEHPDLEEELRAAAEALGPQIAPVERPF